MVIKGYLCYPTIYHGMMIPGIPLSSPSSGKGFVINDIMLTSKLFEKPVMRHLCAVALQPTLQIYRDWVNFKEIIQMVHYMVGK